MIADRKILIAIFCIFSLGLTCNYSEALGIQRKYDFGLIPFGSEVDKVPKWAIREDCTTGMAGFNDCSFYDSSGIQYIIINGDVAEKEIILNSRNAASLPYGIVPNRSTAHIVGDVSKRLGLNFGKNEDGSYEAYIVGEAYDGLAVILRFDKNGKFFSVKLWSLAT